MSNVVTRKDTPNDSARHFLLKLNANDCLSGKPQPQTPSDWEGTYFQSTNPRETMHKEKLPPERRKRPDSGDNLLIWINMDTGGTGLTAVARVSSCEKQGARLRIGVENVSLLSEPRINDTMLRPGDKTRRPNDALEDIKWDRRSNLRFLSPSNWEAIVARTGSKSTPDGNPKALRLIAIASRQTAQLQEERERVWNLIERRQNQGPFREGLILREKGRCAVTGCSVLDVLEAAHLIPFATGEPMRDALENGILLRADIHTLFDRGLMAVDPDTRELWMSDKLVDGAYRSLGAPGRIIETKANQENLRYHFDWARKQDLP